MSPKPEQPQPERTVVTEATDPGIIYWEVEGNVFELATVDGIRQLIRDKLIILGADDSIEVTDREVLVWMLSYLNVMQSLVGEKVKLVGPFIEEQAAE